jgi:Fe-S-cluster containining protein
VAYNYYENYSLGLVPNDTIKGLRAVCLKLKKPCPHLEDNLCTIYAVRPLPCILFPENVACEGRLAEKRQKEEFKDFLCLHHPVALSTERRKIIARLQAMWDRESLISSYYLFKDKLCYFDTTSLSREMLNTASNSKAAASEKAQGSQETIANHLLEHFFLQHIGRCQPFAGADEKIHQLDGPEGLNRFCQLLQDDELVKKIKRKEKGRRLVFGFVRGKLKIRRRSLTPAVYSFYS